MNSVNASRIAGTRPLALIASLVTALALSSAQAETVSTINGVEIDSTVLNFYMQSRTQQPVEQISADQRGILLNELEDIYLLATQDAAKTVMEDPTVKAQIELQTRSLIAQNVAQKIIGDMAITDADILAEYESQSQIAPPRQYKARHILVESQGEATAIIADLDGGADFATLAQEKSTGPSGPRGGDLGWFSPEQMVKPFSDAVVALADGAYTKAPVQTQFGWHVILREESRDQEAPPLDSVKDTIRQALQQKRFQAYLDEIRANAAD